MKQIGPYAIEGELGRGGMGVVFRAQDTRLDRAVAIKALPVEVAADPDRLVRFHREAKTLAQLSHPNLAGIYGIEEHDGSTYLVLEFVEGITLADRLDQGPLDQAEAIEIAVQIARGVAAAHDAGIVHRDLKPANVILDENGKAKVLDFGLARSDEAGSSSVWEAETQTTPVRHSPTLPGVILGTAAYMSPEQARGRKVDRRTDIWSFGVIVYEMLTGASPFAGESANDSIGAVLHKQIDMNLLPATVREPVRRVIARCIERDRELRYRDIGDAANDLRHAAQLQSGDESSRAAGVSIPVFAAAVGLTAVVGGAATWFGAGPVPAPLQAPAEFAGSASETATRVFDLAAPEGYVFIRRDGPPRFSESGNRILLMVGQVNSDGSIGDTYPLVRDLQTGEDLVFDQAGPGGFPIWTAAGDVVWGSMEGVMYFADGESGRIMGTRAVGGSGPPQGAETFSDELLIAAISRSLHAFNPSTGEQLEPLPFASDDDPGGGFPAWPARVGDSSFYLYTLTTHESADGIYLGSMDDGEQVRLVRTSESQSRYRPASDGGHGWLYWSQDDRILRSRLNLDERRLEGEPEIAADGVWKAQWPYFAPFDVNERGELAFFHDENADYDNELVILDVESGVESPAGVYGSLWNPTFSSDDTRLLLDVTIDATHGDIYSFDLTRNYLRTLISSDRVNETFPIWVGSDNTTVAFNHDGDLFIADHDGVTRPRKIGEVEGDVFVCTATPDGSEILFRYGGRESPRLYAIDVATEEITPWLDLTVFDARLSADGDWVVISTGDREPRVELRRWPSGEDRVVITSGRAWSPEITHDMSSIFFAEDDWLCSVDLAWPDDGGPPSVSPPVKRHFEPAYREYDVNSDGTRVIAVKRTERTMGPSIRIVTTGSR